MKKTATRILLALAVMLLLPLFSLLGTGTGAEAGAVYAAVQQAGKSGSGKNNKTSGNQASNGKQSGSDTRAEVTVEEDGSYDSKEEVALYLYLYGELPSNYMTKKAAKKLGWEGGSLEQYAPGKCIGGSYFGNNEGILPEEDEYCECDIDTLGKSKRGAKRIVYSEDGDIYYTEDHYQTFVLLYTADGPVEEEIIYKAD